MEYSLETIILSDGERYSLLTDSNGMPHFYSTLWVTVKLRPTMLVNTINNRLGAVKWFFQWEKKENRDLYSEFQRGEFLDEDDISSLKNHLAIDIAHMKGISKRNKTRNKVISLKDTPQLIDVTPPVGRTHQYNRMTSVAEYLDFIAKLAVKDKNDAKLTRAISAMLKKFKASRPKGKGKNVMDKHSEKNLPDGLIEEFMAVAHYDNPKNPFKHEETKRRNHLMFQLLEETGIRRGELLSLVLTNMVLTGDKPSIWIRRKHDDIHDPRKRQPVSKTKERKLRVSKKTAVLIDEYICNYRSKAPNANKHPYLFVTHRKCKTQGQPLSVSTFDNIIMGSMRKVDERFLHIHPHYFRHYWNEKFSIKIDSNNELAAKQGEGGKNIHVSPGDEAKMRKHQLGHNSEKSGDIYNQRFVEKKADELVLLDQKELQHQLDELKTNKGK